MKKDTAPPGAVAVNVADPETSCDGRGEVTTGAALPSVTATWVPAALHRSFTLQSTARRVWAPLASPHVDQVVVAVPLFAATGAPRGAPSTKKRTLGAVEAAVRLTTPVTDDASAGLVSAGTVFGATA